MEGTDEGAPRCLLALDSRLRGNDGSDRAKNAIALAVWAHTLTVWLGQAILAGGAEDAMLRQGCLQTQYEAMTGSSRGYCPPSESQRLVRAGGSVSDE